MPGEEQYLYLTTVGRQTGLRREIEIWFAPLGGRFYLIAEKREQANWVQNILLNPRITFRVGDREFSGVARAVDEASETDLRQRVCEMFERKYGWSDGLVVELIPASDPVLAGR
jgi:deazaflavin-dependent oxidoreductase (nitroreductase family)